MLFIAHRGNTKGSNPNYENNPNYLLTAQQQGYDVEVDIWWCLGAWFLGHDYPQYLISVDFFKEMSVTKTFYHAKNSEAFEQLINSPLSLHVFWHENDHYTLTSRGIPWVYPGKRLFKNSICVMPELGYNGDLNNCLGICTDNIEKFKSILK